MKLDDPRIVKGSEIDWAMITTKRVKRVCATRNIAARSVIKTFHGRKLIELLIEKDAELIYLASINNNKSSLVFIEKLSNGMNGMACIKSSDIEFV